MLDIGLAGLVVNRLVGGIMANGQKNLKPLGTVVEAMRLEVAYVKPEVAGKNLLVERRVILLGIGQ